MSSEKLWHDRIEAIWLSPTNVRGGCARCYDCKYGYENSPGTNEFGRFGPSDDRSRGSVGETRPFSHLERRRNLQPPASAVPLYLLLAFASRFCFRT